MASTFPWKKIFGDNKEVANIQQKLVDNCFCKSKALETIYIFIIPIYEGILKHLHQQHYCYFGEHK